MLYLNKEKLRVFCTRSSFPKQSSRYKVLIIAPANNIKKRGKSATLLQVLILLNSYLLH